MSVVPPNGLILVTGANGYIGSVTVKVLLDRGYSIRGTVRSATKHQYLLSYFGPNFSLAEVPDIYADGAFDEAIKGVDGIAHMAADTMGSADPIIIERAKRGMLNVLTAAAREPSVKRVVVTSSQGACVRHRPGVPYQITPDTWNEDSLKELEKPVDPKNMQERLLDLYCASKVEGERVAWAWVREHKPGFVFNSVVPNVNMGTVVAPEHLGFSSSGALIRAVDRGNLFGPKILPSQWYIYTEDDALVHFGALTLEDVQNERILAMAGRYTWTGILEILHRRYPDRQSMLKSVDEPLVDQQEVENQRSIEILQRLGQPGFKTLEETIVASMESIIAADSLGNIPKTRADEVAEMVRQAAGAA